MHDRPHDPTAEGRTHPTTGGPHGSTHGPSNDRTTGRRDGRPSSAEGGGGRGPASRTARAAGTALAAAALGAFVLVGDAGPASAQHAAAEAPPAELTAETAADVQEKSLYQRLGGLYPIASVVDVFIDLLLHNDVLNENPAIRKARDAVPTPGLKYHVTAMVCQATGGPCEYTGRSMEEAHAHLNIGEREWEAMLSDLRRTLNDFQVPEQEQEELIAIVETTKDDIVVED